MNDIAITLTQLRSFIADERRWTWFKEMDEDIISSHLKDMLIDKDRGWRYYYNCDIYLGRAMEEINGKFISRQNFCNVRTKEEVLEMISLAIKKCVKG